MLFTFRRVWVLSSWLFVLTVGNLRAEDDTPPVDYLREVRPILAQNCFQCHGPDESTREAGLRLDRREDALEKLDSGTHAVVPGKPSDSEVMVRLTTEDEYLKMPPPESGRQLTQKQIDIVRRWIQQKAPYAKHWSFQPLQRPRTPAVKDTVWPRNPIDHFVLSRLESRGISPSPSADRSTLIRRLSLDLLGLPPSPDDVEQFVNDNRPDAYVRLVDRLLASPHFGERWGRHWLDLARYADSDGYLGDGLRPYAWMYRDWVIKAINHDLPFDEFTTAQLAGDLIPNATLDQKIATGFHRNSMKNTEAGADRELDRVQRTVDRVSTTSTIWLGLTLGCAECHSHKFDPISHTEFYQMYAFFNQLDDRDIPAAPAPVQERYERRYKSWKTEVEDVKSAIQRIVNRLNASTDQSEANDESEAVDRDAILTILRKVENKRTDDEREQLKSLFARLIPDEQTPFDRYEQLAATKPNAPAIKAPTVASVSKQRPTHVHLRGDYRRKGNPVQPATPEVLHPLKARGDAPDRLDLAQWLMDPANPLTPRTTVNQIWKPLFGRGLVNTIGDFGTSGETPSHPELLDWLATTFRDEGWSRKQLIRQIVISATYRQSSHHRPKLAQIDPLNTLLARQSRFRLEAEVVRDVSLAASGLLHPKIGGPSIRPHLDARVISISRNQDWKISDGRDRYRRGLYILFRRGTPYPMLTTFDAPDTTVSCPQREVSNSPLQSLTLLNDPVFFECAQHLANRLLTIAGEEPEEWIAESYQTCLGRKPTEQEQQRALDYLSEQRQLIESASDEDLRKLVGKSTLAVDLKAQALRVAWARVLMNLDEFITRE
ncbi:PSD1 and planctomycete cytochrome C domain-containing protein [Thalassoroseus pseudoceratinae]|uniref:PSD1 and planctomycete cytochrome C domain-containing protein n=1 Tax=Thalassoroseus pseudoceratinae TaxID=2713176 RepID=UPI0014212AB1|nr:DUF1553 domain-containing protein [Thalassoroseus pseudoceratinae]